ncbi:asparaginase-domain-containing protein [Rhizoctonia solani]|nr:asparaginase-domain-containing protein [Rhizoctonia solani]
MPAHPSLTIPMPMAGIGDSESRVLIIYTGGTIGMLVNELGSYAPEPFFLTQTLRAQARFHDPEGASLFSNSITVANYRQWSTRESGASTPLAIGTPGNHQPELLVRSSKPIPHQSVQGGGVKKDGYYEGHLPSLVTPRSKAVGGNTKRWQPLLDSSNMRPEDWLAIATEIELNYNTYDGFIILHGTDTMCYTSSALSFLLEDLGKTVIITGAQIPLSQLRNDGIENLLGALSIAGQYVIPEVCLYFNHTLFRGNRVSKVSSFDLNAFSSPNFPPLVNVGIDIVVNWSEVIRSNSMQRFRAHKDMSVDVATLRLFPGITTPIVRAFLAPPLQGVVLETFGAGNAPQRPDLLDTLREACARGVVIVAISQCAKGSVSPAYDTGRTLAECGVVPGGDMTPECALAKLAYLLSKKDLTPAGVRELVSQPLRGELTLPTPLTRPTTTSLDSIQDLLSEILRLSQPSNVSNDSTGTAPWSATASHANSTELALLPYLMHLAVARDDPVSVANTASHPRHQPSQSAHGTPTTEQPHHHLSGPNQFAQGAANAPLPGSLHTPLHTAALQGSARCTRALLEVGALVHVRDALDHTCLFYAARVRAREVVEMLVEAGAHLGETDKRVALGIGIVTGKEEQEIWELAGLEIN